MAFESSEIQTLIDLGLTSVQARVYLTLTRYGPSKITSISKQSKIARPDVYRTLSKLHELSLVEQMVETPIRFRAIPIEKGVEALLHRKTQEYEILKKDSELLLNAFSSKENTKEIQTEDSLFVLIPKKEAVIKRQIEAVQETKKSIDVVLSWNRFYHGTELFDQHYKKAIDRKVYVRFIVENPPSEKLKDEALSTHNNDFCKMRFIKENPKAIFGIYDQKKLMLLVDPVCDVPGSSPSLWTNNQSLIGLIHDYFDNLWEKAEEKPAISKRLPIAEIRKKKV